MTHQSTIQTQKVSQEHTGKFHIRVFDSSSSKNSIIPHEKYIKGTMMQDVKGQPRPLHTNRSKEILSETATRQILLHSIKLSQH